MNTLLHAVSQYRLSLSIIAILSFCTAVLQLVVPLYVMQVFDHVLVSSPNSISLLSGLTTCALLLLVITGAFRHIFARQAANRLDNELGSRVLYRAVTAKARGSDFDQNPLRQLETVRSFAASRTMLHIIDLPFAFLLIACLFLVQSALFWLTVSGAAMMLALVIINRIVSAELVSDEQENDFVVEPLFRNADSVVAMSMTDHLVSYWQQKRTISQTLNDRVAFNSVLFGGISRAVRYLTQLSVFCYAIFLAGDGTISTGMVLAATLVSGLCLKPIEVTIENWARISKARLAWNDLSEFLSGTPDDEAHIACEQPARNGELWVEGLSHFNAKSDTGRALLTDVSFTLNPGESVAVVGPSGSGKSTLANILAGALPHAQGTVLLCGQSIGTNCAPDMRSRVGYMPQNAELLPGTLAQNIARFTPEADVNAIREAVELAGIETLIARLPQGLETKVGPQYPVISRGEQQRIALARAFFGDPQLVVLDEPNANLDAEGEEGLKSALTKAKMLGITVVVVTQRETLVQAIDKIIHIEDGKLVDFGDRDDVIRKQAERLRAMNRQMREAAQQFDTVGTENSLRRAG